MVKSSPFQNEKCASKVQLVSNEKCAEKIQLTAIGALRSQNKGEEP
jgi:hypothetical protein